MSGYGSHLKILKALMDNVSIKKVIETGMGDYSTKLFVERGCQFVSIEMHNQKWYEKTEAKYKGQDREFHCWIGKYRACEYIESVDPDVDLIFIDGHEATRFIQFQQAFHKARYVAAHDTEALIYRWDRIRIPKGWVWIDFVFTGPPWTTIAMRQEDYNANKPWINKMKNSVYTRDNFN